MNDINKESKNIVKNTEKNIGKDSEKISVGNSEKISEKNSGDELNYEERFEKFNQKIKGAMEKRFGEDYIVQIKEVTKTNGLTIHGLTILKKTEHVCPTIYLESYFDRYLEGEPLSDIVAQIVELFEASNSVCPEGLEFFTDYEQVKERLFVKLINAGMNEKLLENVPHRRFLDLAIVAVVRVEMKGCGTGTILVHNNHICMWGVKEETLINDAMEKTYSEGIHRITPMEELIEEIRQRIERDMEDIEEFGESGDSTGMYVITNDSQMFGAAMITFPEVLKEAAETVGGDFYILPSSVHEVILIDRKLVSEPMGMNSMIEEVNSSLVKQDEILSDHAYLYLCENESLISVTGESLCEKAE